MALLAESATGEIAKIARQSLDRLNSTGMRGGLVNSVGPLPMRLVRRNVATLYNFFAASSNQTNDTWSICYEKAIVEGCD